MFIGRGGLLKSLVGICRLHCLYPGHCHSIRSVKQRIFGGDILTSNRIETLGPRPSKTSLSWSRRRFVRECKASVSGIPHSSGPSIQKIIGGSNDTSSIYLLMSLVVCGLYIFRGINSGFPIAAGSSRALFQLVICS